MTARPCHTAAGPPCIPLILLPSHASENLTLHHAIRPYLLPTDSAEDPIFLSSILLSFLVFDKKIDDKKMTWTILAVKRDS
jgi:hypothetical protein